MCVAVCTPVPLREGRREREKGGCGDLCRRAEVKRNRLLKPRALAREAATRLWRTRNAYICMRVILMHVNTFAACATCGGGMRVTVYRTWLQLWALNKNKLLPLGPLWPRPPRARHTHARSQRTANSAAGLAIGGFGFCTRVRRRFDSVVRSVCAAYTYVTLGRSCCYSRGKGLRLKKATGLDNMSYAACSSISQHVAARPSITRARVISTRCISRRFCTCPSSWQCPPGGADLSVDTPLEKPAVEQPPSAPVTPKGPAAPRPLPSSNAHMSF